MKKWLLFSCLLSLFVPLQLLSQNWLNYDSIRVQEGTNIYDNPFAGGLDLPQFSKMDLDQDGILDLFVFDRHGTLVVPFLNNGSSASPEYTFAPQYSRSFPPMKSWALDRDYNCDGKVDIFTNYIDGIAVYKNISTPGNLAFQLVEQKLDATFLGIPEDIYVISADIPAIRDVDGDGDLDILTFDSGGTVVYFYRNEALPAFNCDSLIYIRSEDCWGKFSEAGFSNNILLNITCKGGGSNSSTALHSGSTLEVYDQESDGDMDMILGDLIGSNLVYLRNGGTVNSALIDTFDFQFPQYDVSVNVDQFAAAFVLDADNDTLADMIVAPNAGNVSMNYRNVWMYKNIGTGGVSNFTRVSLSFLQDEMLDFGSVSRPAVFDENADGLPDLLIGNSSIRSPNQNYSGLTLLRNTGTANRAAFTLVTRDYQGISSLFTPAIFGTSPAFGDMDNDGDLDLLLGDSDGKLHLLSNSAGQGNPPVYSLTNRDYFLIDQGQYSTPFIVDLDRDNLPDIVMGQMSGNLIYFRNTGTATNAFFSATPTSLLLGGIDTDPICCTGYSVPFFFEDTLTGQYRLVVGSEKGRALLYGNIDGNVNGQYSLLDSNFLDLNEGIRVSLCSANLDGDSREEWIVGNARGGISIKDNTSLTGRNSHSNSINMRLVPNPSAHPFLILEKEANIEIRVMNVQGQILGNIQPRTGKYFEMEMDGLPAGLYFVEVRDDAGKSAALKWIKLEN